MHEHSSRIMSRIPFIEMSFGARSKLSFNEHEQQLLAEEVSWGNPAAAQDVAQARKRDSV